MEYQRPAAQHYHTPNHPLANMKPKTLLTLLLFLRVFAPNLLSQACIGTGTLNVTVQDCTGTGSPQAIDLEIFPNPAQSSFWVKAGEEPVSIELFDGFGLQKLEQTIGSNTRYEVRVENFPRGFYLVYWRSRTQSGAKFVLITAN